MTSTHGPPPSDVSQSDAELVLWAQQGKQGSFIQVILILLTR